MLFEFDYLLLEVLGLRLILRLAHFKGFGNLLAKNFGCVVDQGLVLHELLFIVVPFVPNP